ncbi:MAG: hypothetical protein ACC656_13120, partial [Candidatus Heimdallarchaeota archaeon]
MKKNKLFVTGVMLCLITFISVSGVSSAVVQSTPAGESSDDSRPGKGQPFSPERKPPTGINITKTDRARQMVTERAQFWIHANSSVPSLVWGDRDYEIQNKINIEALVEYTDQNNNNQYDLAEQVQVLELNESTIWNFTEISSNDTTSVISIYTQEVNVLGFESVLINLTYYLNAGSTYMKFDIEIENWPWDSDQNRLAFGFGFEPTKLQEKMQINKFDKVEDDPTGLNQPAGLYVKNSAGNIVGYVMSSDFAFKSNKSIEIDVISQIEINNDKFSANLYLNYPYFGDYLLHDPIIGSSGDTLVDV